MWNGRAADLPEMLASSGLDQPIGRVIGIFRQNSVEKRKASSPSHVIVCVAYNGRALRNLKQTIRVVIRIDYRGLTTDRHCSPATGSVVGVRDAALRGRFKGKPIQTVIGTGDKP